MATLNYALNVLETLGVQVMQSGEEFWCEWPPEVKSSPHTAVALETFTAAIAEENFRRRYFAAAPSQRFRKHIKNWLQLFQQGT